MKPSTTAPGLPHFPTMLRRMWSGGEVQKWLDENVAPVLANARADAFQEAASVDAKVLAMLMSTGKVSRVDVDAALAQVADYERQHRTQSAIAPTKTGQQEPVPVTAIAGELMDDGRADWLACEKVANVEGVFDAMQVFSEDPTGDNGVGVVVAIVEALASRADSNGGQDG